MFDSPCDKALIFDESIKKKFNMLNYICIFIDLSDDLLVEAPPITSPLTAFCFFIIIQIDSLWLIVHSIKDNRKRVWCLMFEITCKIRESQFPPPPYISKLVIQLAVYSLIGLSRLRLATFEHLLRLGASFCHSNNVEQFVPFEQFF